MSMHRQCVCVCVCVCDVIYLGGYEQPTAVASHGGTEAGRCVLSRRTPELLPPAVPHDDQFARTRSVPLSLGACVNVCILDSCSVS